MTCSKCNGEGWYPVANWPDDFDKVQCECQEAEGPMAPSAWVTSKPMSLLQAAQEMLETLLEVKKAQHNLPKEDCDYCHKLGLWAEAVKRGA